MRLARKMLLLVVAAAAVMALVAPSASATNAVTYVKADGKTSCGTVAGAHPTYTGGCHFHWEGEITLFFHIFGFEGTEAKCHIEIRGYIGTTGEGRITGYHIKQGGHGDASCTESVYPPCSEAVAAMYRFPWHIRVEKLASGVIRMTIRLCIDPVESGVCEGVQSPAVTEAGALGAEVQTQTATDQTVGGSFCEFTFSLNSEAVAPAEVTHLRP